VQVPDKRDSGEVKPTFSKGNDHWGDLGVDGWIILEWISRRWDVYMDWIGMAQDRDRWRTLVSAVMNLRVP